MEPVVTGALIGAGAVTFGQVLQQGGDVFRASRDRRRTRRQAITAVVGELLATASILDMALERQAWWPEGDEPKHDEWDRYQDQLFDLLDQDDFMVLRMTYESLRSLAASRSSPVGPVPRGRLRRLVTSDPQGNTFFSLIWVDGRWPWADSDTRDTFNSVWKSLNVLRPVHRKVARRRERKQMDREEREAAELPAPGGGAELPAPEPESAP